MCRSVGNCSRKIAAILHTYAKVHKQVKLAGTFQKINVSPKGTLLGLEQNFAVHYHNEVTCDSISELDEEKGVHPD